MTGFGRMHKEGGRAGAGEGCRQLAGHVTGFADAGDDHASTAAQDEIDRLDETIVELIAKRAHGVRFDVEHVLLRFVLTFLFYLFNAFLYWVMQRALLAQNVPFGVIDTFLNGALNAAVAVPLFLMLDRLKVSRA